MTQLRVLLRLQMTMIGNMFTGGMRRSDTKTKKGKTVKAGTVPPGKKILFAVLYLYLIAVFVFLFGALFMMIAPAYAEAGIGWLYFTMAFVLMMGLMLIGSVFLAKSMLFEAKDNDLLLAMPIPPGTILLSRMAALYLMNLAYGLTVALPAIFCWIWCNGFPGVVPFASFLLLFLAAALFALALSCLLGWGLAKLGSRIRNKTFITVFATLLFLGVCYYFIGQGMDRVLAYISENGTVLAEKLGVIAPLYWLGAACASVSVPALLGALLIFCAVFAAVYVLLSKTFIRTATTARGFKKEVYRGGEMKTSSAFSALLRRENTRLLNSSVYLLNSGLGVVFQIGIAVYLVIQKDTILGLLLPMLDLGKNAGEDLLCAAAAIIGCYTGSLCMFTAPSVSLEGKTLWVLRSLPVSAADVLRSKLALHLVWTLPGCIIYSVLISITLSGGNIPGIVMIFLLPVLFSAATAVLGLIFGILNPNFEWINEAQAVKQGMPVLYAMLSGMVLSAGPAFLLFLAEIPVPAFYIGTAALYALIAVWGYRWIVTSGAKRFDSFPA